MNLTYRHSNKLFSSHSSKRVHPTFNVGASSSVDEFLGHNMHLAKRVLVNFNTLKQEIYLFATLEELHDVFVELCALTLIISKCMGSYLRKNKGSAKVEKLKAQLSE